MIGLLATESEIVTRLRVPEMGASRFVLPRETHAFLGAKKALALLDRWLADDSGYDEETWPTLREALDHNRLADRKLFDG